MLADTFMAANICIRYTLDGGELEINEESQNRYKNSSLFRVHAWLSYFQWNLIYSLKWEIIVEIVSCRKSHYKLIFLFSHKFPTEDYFKYLFFLKNI